MIAPGVANKTSWTIQHGKGRNKKGVMGKKAITEPIDTKGATKGKEQNMVANVIGMVSQALEYMLIVSLTTFMAFCVVSEASEPDVVLSMDFESVAIGESLAKAGWQKKYGAGDPVHWTVVEPGGAGNESSKVVRVDGADVQIWRSFDSANTISEEDSWVFFSVYLRPLVRGGRTHNIGVTAATEDDKTGPYFGLGATNSYRDVAFSLAGNISPEPVTIGHWYELVLQINTTTSMGSLFARDLSERAETFKPVSGLSDVPLHLNDKWPYQWSKWWLRGDYAGELDNLKIGVGRMVSQRISIDEAMGFEVQGAWHTAPLKELAVMRGHSMYASRSHPTGGPLHVPEVGFAELNGGLTLSRNYVKEGQFAGLWKDHDKYPTVACWRVPEDWSRAQAFEIFIYSEKNTNELVTLAVLSNNDSTPWKDYYTHQFRIDWEGWKTFRVPLEDFIAYEQPAGWDNIDGIYFFAKAGGAVPNPYTTLYLDDIRLSGTRVSSPDNRVPDSNEGFIYQQRLYDKPIPLNHEFSEIDEKKNFTAGKDYIVYMPYFRDERAQFKYFPRFIPGFPSFDPNGKAYINAGNVIQRLGENGQWVSSDIKSVLIRWAREQEWAGVRNNWGWQGADTVIRFDHDGGVYVLEQVTRLDQKGKEVSWKYRTPLLLYSKDKMRTWNVYPLPAGGGAAFERRDGHNDSALNNPPVIVWSAPQYFEDARRGGYLILPQKKPDGSLQIPEPVRYALSNIGGLRHSGKGNVAITSGDKIYITYGWMPPYGEISTFNRGGKTYMTRVMEGKKPLGTWSWDMDMAEDLGMPPIPSNHPMLDMKFPRKTHWEFTGWSRNGVPTYVVEYDLKDEAFSEPVYVGSGGSSIDSHNWPSITIDGNGILHVVINGHIEPAVYTRSTSPMDISKWSNPVYVGSTKYPGLSYGSLNCGKDDTLYMVCRSDTQAYNHRLSLYRKRSGENWEDERTLVAPFGSGYYIWYHAVAYDIQGDRLFLTYYSQPAAMLLTRDMYEFFTFYYPFLEKGMYNTSGFPGSGEGGPPQPGKGSIYYGLKARYITTLVSEDHGDTWHLATTEDFK